MQQQAMAQMGGMCPMGAMGGAMGGPLGGGMGGAMGPMGGGMGAGMGAQVSVEASRSQQPVEPLGATRSGLPDLA